MWRRGGACLTVATVAFGLAVATAAPAEAAPAIRDFGTAPDIAVNGAVFHEGSGLVYAITTDWSAAHPNELVAFDPETGQIVDSVWVGSQPGLVDISSDGSTVWVALTGSASMAEVDRATMTLTRTVGLTADASPRPRFPTDIAPIPGDADAVAVVLDYEGTSARAGIVLVRDGSVESTQISHDDGGQSIAAVSSDRVVGFTNTSSGWGFWQLDVVVDGIEVNGPKITSSLSGFGTQITYAGGVVYGSDRSAIDPDTGGDIATFGSGGSPLRPVIHDGRAYFHDSSGNEIEVWSTSTFSVDGPAIPVPSSTEGMVLTDEGWILWDGDNEFITDVVTVAPTVDGSGVRHFAAVPDVTVNDAAYDPVGDVVYVVAGGAAPSYANHVLAFDPHTGVVAWSTFVGSEPDIVEVSTDGSVVWVGLDGANDLVEVDVATESVTRTIDLGSGVHGPSYVASLAPVPGHSDRVVVSTRRKGVSPAHEKVVLVSGGLIQPDEVDDHSGATALAAVSSTRVAGFDNASSGYSFYRFAVSASGVTNAFPADRTMVRLSGVQISANDGVVYASNRTAVDGETAEPVATFGEGSSRIAPVASDGEVYFYSRFRDQIEVFDRTTFHNQGQPIEFVDELEGMLLTSAGWVTWTHGGEFVLGESEEPPPPPVETATVRGTLVDEDTGAPIAGQCAAAFTAGVSPLEFVADAVTSLSGQYVLELPVGSYWILFANCDGIRYFHEWYDDVLPFDLVDISVVTLASHEVHWLDGELSPIFYDVPEGTYYYEPVLFLRDSGITRGCSAVLYCPEDFVTREQMAAFIGRFWRFIDGECDYTPTPLIDVPVTSFAYDDVACIFNLGITTGTNATSYSPADLVTREQMAAFIARLWRALDLECPPGGHPFVDVHVNSFGFDDIACIYLLGITTGTSPTTYSPGQFVTRAQMAAFLDRLLGAVFDE